MLVAAVSLRQREAGIDWMQGGIDLAFRLLESTVHALGDLVGGDYDVRMCHSYGNWVPEYLRLGLGH